METTLQKFTFDNNGLLADVRVHIGEQGEPWFVANDICNLLDINNPRDAVSRLDEDERSGVGITDTIGREKVINCINESGLYSLILTSRKDSAKRFKKWVTAEVLPSIRKYGYYQLRDMAAPTRQVIDLQKQAASLLSQLQITGNKAAREYLYQLLQGVSQLLNIPAPTLESLDNTPAEPVESPLVMAFLLNLQKITLAGKSLNHCSNPQLMGINLNEYQQACEALQLPVQNKTRLTKALRTSLRFVGANVTVNSAIKRTSVKCWLLRNSLTESEVD